MFAMSPYLRDNTEGNRSEFLHVQGTIHTWSPYGSYRRRLGLKRNKWLVKNHQLDDFCLDDASGQISSRPHTTKNHQKVAFWKGNPLF